MKRHFQFLTTIWILTFSVFAKDGQIQNQSETPCGARLWLHFEEQPNGAKLNIIVGITNVSTNTIQIVDRARERDFVFTVIGPSNEIIKPKLMPLDDDVPSRRIVSKLEPGKSYSLKFDFRSLYDITQPDNYKVVGRRKILVEGKNCEIVSNTLSFDLE